MNIQEEIDRRLLEVAPTIKFQGAAPLLGSRSVRTYLMISAGKIFNVRDLQDDDKMIEILNNIIREVKSKAEQLSEIKGDCKYKIVEETRGFESDMAYPRYKDKYSQQDIISIHTWNRLQHYVQERMNDKMFGPNAEVREHWSKILDGIVPFGMRIVGSE